MGLKGICKFMTHRLFEAVIVALLILFIPNIPPYTKISEPFKVAPARPFVGKLALNERLNDAEVWHKGDFLGPEAFADYNGELYTSIHGGDVVKLTGNHITPIVKIGKPCKGVHEEKICGRPLGIQFDKNGALYVSDAYYGIFKVNVATGDKQQIISLNQEIGGKKPMLSNSVVLARNGDIYWTDSSTEFSLEDGVFELLADPSGRLIHYDAKTKRNTVLIEKIHFANGVALSDDEEFVIVAETGQSRIHRYYLKGPKKGSHDIFIDGLPGMPDNLKSDGKGGFLVPLVIARDADHPSLSQVIGPFPLIRKLAARVMGLTELLFTYVNKIYPSEFAEKAVHFVGHFSSFSALMPKRVTILHVSKTGEILDSLHCLNKKINLISEAHIFKDTLYLGSPFNDYIGRIPLSKVGWEHLKPLRNKREVPVEAPKATTTTPKPTQAPTTTTTPRPTTTTQKPTTTSPPPKQTPPPPKQQTPPPVKQQTPPPAKQQTPPPVKQQAPPPVKQQAPPPVKQQTPPPVKQQAPPVKAQTPPPVRKPPVAKEVPQQKQAPPKAQAKPAPVKEDKK